MKPFLQGKQNVAGLSLRPPTDQPRAKVVSCATARTNANHSGQSPVQPGEGASVQVVKEGDKVVRLIVTCVCGEIIEVDCLYPAGT